MNDQGDGPRLWVTILFAAWVMSFGYAFVSFASLEPTGDSFTRGMNRVTSYLGWQGVAGMVALVLFGVGRSWPKGHAIRRMTAVPICLALLHILAIVGIIIWASYTS